MDKKTRKQIPTALRNKIWELHSERKYDMLCPVCNINNISIIDWHCGHIIPDSWGGPVDLENLIPICKDCNYGMGNRYMIDYQKKCYSVDTITTRLQYFNLYSRFCEIQQLFQDKVIQEQQQKLKKHLCNFMPRNRSVKTCKKMCNPEVEYCPNHQKLMDKRISSDIVPMEID